MADQDRERWARIVATFETSGDTPPVTTDNDVRGSGTLNIKSGGRRHALVHRRGCSCRPAGHCRRLVPLLQHPELGQARLLPRLYREEDVVLLQHPGSGLAELLPDARRWPAEPLLQHQGARSEGAVPGGGKEVGVEPPYAADWISELFADVPLLGPRVGRRKLTV